MLPEMSGYTRNYDDETKYMSLLIEDNTII